MALKAEFIPVTEVKVGDRLAGIGEVTAIRLSKSGKTIWFTGPRGNEWPDESTLCNTAVLAEVPDEQVP